MIIDPIDLKLIRLLELHGSIPVNEVIGKFHISEDEILLRIKNLEDTGFISGYGMKLFLPAVTGGKWYWACIACESGPQFDPKCKNVPYLEEIVENLTTPIGYSPDYSFLFFTQNLKDTYKKINKTAGIKYAEVYKINSYSVRVPRILLKEDWRLITRLCDSSRELDYTKIHRKINKPVSDDEVRLSRFIWTKKNRKGIISIFPHYDWSIVNNYVHLHIALTSTLRIKELRRIVNKLGFSGNITSRFKKRYIQVEFDIWGFSNLHSVFSALKKVKKVTIEGYSFAYKNRVHHDWIKDYIKSKV